MPAQDYIYVSDGGHCPYGPKPVDYVMERARKITEWLMKRGCSQIVVACNTATAAAIGYLRSHYDIPFIGMEPAIKPAALHSETGVVGVLATAGTLKGELYHRTLAHFASNVKVIERVGEGLVEAVENGDISSDHVMDLLHRYIDPMLEAGADHIVLGCTHYPFLYDAIKSITGDRAEIINPAPAVARQSSRFAEAATGNGSAEFYTTKKGGEPNLDSLLPGLELNYLDL